MRPVKSNRGFIHLHHPEYLDPSTESEIVMESSAIGDYPDAPDRPGSSYLLFGLSKESYHLNREEVAELVEYLDGWLKTGRLRKVELSEEEKCILYVLHTDEHVREAAPIELSPSGRDTARRLVESGWEPYDHVKKMATWLLTQGGSLDISGSGEIRSKRTSP